MCNLMSLDLLVFKTDGLPLMNMHFVSNYSEGVSCQSQRRFPEKMGESSTGERVKENCFFITIFPVSWFSNCYYYCTMLQDFFKKVVLICVC